MQKMTITIPRTYNDGKMVPVYILNRIDWDIRNLFGGYSRFDVYGQWTDDSGKVYQDESFRYEILTIYPCSDYDRLKAFTHVLCTVLDQKCILTTCQDIQVDFIK